MQDKQTGLTWRRCAERQAWDGSTCSGSAISLSWSQALALANGEAAFCGEAWRLPSAKELASIIDTSRDRPAASPIAFPATPQARFRTSTPVAGRPLDSWVVNFSFGAVDSRQASELQAVRLVRDSR